MNKVRIRFWEFLSDTFNRLGRWCNKRRARACGCSFCRLISSPQASDWASYMRLINGAAAAYPPPANTNGSDSHPS